MVHRGYWQSHMPTKIAEMYKVSLRFWLIKFVAEVRHADGKSYSPNSVYLICCGHGCALCATDRTKIDIFKSLGFARPWYPWLLHEGTESNWQFWSEASQANHLWCWRCDVAEMIVGWFKFTNFAWHTYILSQLVLCAEKQPGAMIASSSTLTALSCWVTM